MKERVGEKSTSVPGGGETGGGWNQTRTGQKRAQLGDQTFPIARGSPPKNGVGIVRPLLRCGTEGKPTSLGGGGSKIQRSPGDSSKKKVKTWKNTKRKTLGHKNKKNCKAFVLRVEKGVHWGGGP